ncbi:metal-dependent hydrolase [Alphaproteobacteria bacterium GH1-50]|uniref:Metal-dependent hydrolase n=1 Tax=Kangsaoukella pontilimi TaxID=2691042 RepID=A0A7C9MU01_9RHOB|nr:endonuclease/exonuclease/phosphatase family protein [Kangsaoukella pontilimi]MXQ06560.1 metal-dependent hydrolase [Kangsaoukella pontilimi]
MSALQAASWNIRKCVGLDWRRDPRRTARVLAGLEADIVALQEADKRLGNRPASLPGHLIAAETQYRPVEVDSHPGSLGWHGNAVLVTGRVDLHEADAIHLPGLEPRGALIVDFGLDGLDWRVVAVHLGLLRQSRQAQKTAIREALAARDRRPTIIMGDFNEWSATKGFDAFADYEVHAPGRTFHASRPVASLDRFVVSRDVAIEDARVIETPVTRIASDHLPISGRFTRR